MVITNSTTDPFYIASANKVEISAKNGTTNEITDLRIPSGEEDPEGGAIYAKCDIEFKGKGTLKVTSHHNNGIHTKDDMTIKNLTLNVTAVNNAIKGNDSITIESGNITAISTGGYALKTTSTDLNKNGEQRGNIVISGGYVELSVPTGDTDNGVTVTGGTLTSVGYIADKVSGAAYNTTQSLAAGDYEIRDALGETVLTFSLSQSYKAYMFCLEASGKYTVLKDGTQLFTFEIK